jgi:predicted AAA+ superfamily ATPase
MGMNVPVDIVTANPGPVFEQWVGIELWKRLAYLGHGQLHHQRSKDGAEIDFIVELEDQFIPIEAKWTENPTLQDARHLVTFLKEKPTQAKQAYIVCRCPRPMKLHDNVTALPWSCL